MYSQWWSRLAALIIFVGFFLTFVPQFVVGYNGMPRRYHRYVPEFQVWNVLSSAGASILAVGYVLPLCYLLYSLRYGKRAGDNPWRATGLEWQTPSPPPRTTSRKRRSSSAVPTNITRERPKMSLEDALFTADEQERLFDRTFLRARSGSKSNTPPRSAARNALPSGCGSSWPRRSCSSACCSLRRRLPLHVSRGFRGGQRATELAASAASIRSSCW